MVSFSLLGLQHPEPNGSRRATPTSTFQHRPGHPRKFSLTYPWNEFATILEGSVTITDASGTAMTFGPGDSHYAEKGEGATWHITTPKVRKCFFLCKDDQAGAAG